MLNNKNQNDKDLICVAKIGKTTGLHGKLKLNIFSDFKEQFKQGSIYFLDNKKQTITIQEYANERVKFEGIDNVDDAKIFTNKLLYVDKLESIKACKLKANEFFYFDIIGCSITQNNQVLGVVEDVNRYANVDYLLIKTSKEIVSFLHNNMPNETKVASTFLLPYLDDYIQNVDIKTKQIQVALALEILQCS